jgi:hypothetical protein
MSDGGQALGALQNKTWQCNFDLKVAQASRLRELQKRKPEAYATLFHCGRGTPKVAWKLLSVTPEPETVTLFDAGEKV